MSILAVHNTTVPPHWYSTLPGVLLVKFRLILTGRISVGLRVMVFRVESSCLTQGDASGQRRLTFDEIELVHSFEPGS